ncbi:hypothetical protein RFI_28078 [Reticulomyxa filosa]|uniref:Uncharacterized protein n=1 Tax=Reticulomyxa filosa TaxID=46433 RepID=X6M8F9_RETFI|nr:hypothetical protein RFI_28078 [Reticulomyxa filosa]|eukprot:ETO09310.1 hypothetical protein RFI_28078 [Reticulomyxa filosa]
MRKSLFHFHQYFFLNSNLSHVKFINSETFASNILKYFIAFLINGKKGKLLGKNKEFSLEQKNCNKLFFLFQKLDLFLEVIVCKSSNEDYICDYTKTFLF